MENYYKICDRNTIAWLRHMNYKFDEVKVENNKKVWFMFKDTEELRKDINDFINKKEFTISPYELMKDLESVTEIIFHTIKSNR